MERIWLAVREGSDATADGWGEVERVVDEALRVEDAVIIESLGAGALATLRRLLAKR